MPTVLDVTEETEVNEAIFASVFLEILSYRMPMRIQELLIIGRTSYYRCPRCEQTLEREFMSYCDRCGQCLDWKGRRSAKKTYL